MRVCLNKAYSLFFVFPKGISLPQPKLLSLDQLSTFFQAVLLENLLGLHGKAQGHIAKRLPFLNGVFLSLPVGMYSSGVMRCADKATGNAKSKIKYIFLITKQRKKIRTLKDVGLGYLTLGQASTTISGGEAQRVKLATELAKRDTGKTLYVLDEPTTGLHFEDIKVLMNVLNKLVDRSNTVLIIEHNMDVIKMADWIIDMGPEGGDRGGRIVCQGTPEQVAQCAESYTGKYLSLELGVRK